MTTFDSLIFPGAINTPKSLLPALRKPHILRRATITTPDLSDQMERKNRGMTFYWGGIYNRLFGDCALFKVQLLFVACLKALFWNMYKRSGFLKAAIWKLSSRAYKKRCLRETQTPACLETHSQGGSVSTALQPDQREQLWLPGLRQSREQGHCSHSRKPWRRQPLAYITSLFGTGTSSSIITSHLLERMKRS